MTLDDKLAALILGASVEQLRIIAAALWDGLNYVRPTNQTREEWYDWLCKVVGVQA